jgi:hypothetical protein
VEAAFKDLKDDLSLRPIFHSLERRIEGHIFVSFLAYCLHACLRPLAPGLTPRPLLEKFAAMQMLDVLFRPPTDGNWSSAATPSRRKITKCSWPNWAGNCSRNHRRGSPKKVNCCRGNLAADLFEPSACLQPLTRRPTLQWRKSG